MFKRIVIVAEDSDGKKHDIVAIERDGIEHLSINAQARWDTMMTMRGRELVMLSQLCNDTARACAIVTAK